ncbi:RloB family protein [Herbidospora cretacea]|uniref:RloB family protein n=1 Tax=Herbidospora cretacea TaxID=28444 RepID=UPI0004C36694|nr:RloB family protein [Herbidospora cretacea]
MADRVFFAVCEGRVTEYDYLTLLQNLYGAACSFRIDMPAPGSRRDDMKPEQVADFAIRVAESDGDQYTEIWALFDRDQHAGIPQALNRLARHAPKVRVAFSHPSFDFWLYLHFAGYDVPLNGSSQEIVKRLNQREAWTRFGRDKRLTEARAADLAPHVVTAAGRARGLEKRCAADDCTHTRGGTVCGLLERDPGSGMGALIESLGIR